jgi:hypothetical protein
VARTIEPRFGFATLVAQRGEAVLRGRRLGIREIDVERVGGELGRLDLSAQRVTSSRDLVDRNVQVPVRAHELAHGDVVLLDLIDERRRQRPDRGRELADRIGACGRGRCLHDDDQRVG